MIGKLLGHRQVQTTAGYAHLAQESVKASAGRVAESIAHATAGVKLSENGQFENAAIAGLGRAAPGPSDREEDDFSIGCGRRYLEESGTFIPAVYEHFRNGADSTRHGGGAYCFRRRASSSIGTLRALSP